MKVQLEEFNERRQKHREELCLSMNKSQHIELENSTESNIPLQDEESFHSSEFNMTSCKNESEKISLVERKGWDKRKFKTSESSPKRTSYITKSNDSIVMEDDNNESSRRQSIETKGIIENKMFKDSSNYLKHISSTNMLKIIKESSFVYNNFEEECEKT